MRTLKFCGKVDTLDLYSASISLYLVVCCFQAYNPQSTMLEAKAVKLSFILVMQFGICVSLLGASTFTAWTSTVFLGARKVKCFLSLYSTMMRHCRRSGRRLSFDWVSGIDWSDTHQDINWYPVTTYIRTAILCSSAVPYWDLSHHLLSAKTTPTQMYERSYYLMVGRYLQITVDHQLAVQALPLIVFEIYLLWMILLLVEQDLVVW